MRKMIGLLLSPLAVFILSTTVFAGDFEGEIHTKMMVAGQPQGFDTVSFVKGENFRQEGQTPDGRTFVSIYDARRKVVIMPNAENKTYVEWAVGEEAAANTPGKMFVFERTGKTDTVAGYGCDIILVKEKDTGKLNSDVCVTKGLGGLGRTNTGSQSFESWMQDLLKDGGYPLRMTTRKPDGSEEIRTETTRVVKKRLNDNLFAAPAGYTKVDMGSMMGGGAGRPSGTGAQSQGGRDFEKMMGDPQQRKAQKGGAARGQKEDAPPPDMNELMKQFDEMMKKQQGSK